MAMSRTPWTQKINDLLEEGPQSRDFLIAVAGALVPPGQAARSTEGRRLQNIRKRGFPEHPRMLQWRDPVLSGRRKYIRENLISMVERGKISRFVDENGEVWYKKER